MTNAPFGDHPNPALPGEMLPPPPRGPSDRERTFARVYVQTGSLREAAEAAGYRHDGGADLLARPQVQQILSEVREQTTQTISETVERVLTDLRIVADSCMTPDENGKIDAAGANKALELIGKYLAMFTDRVENLGDRRVFMVTDPVDEGKAEGDA